MSTQTLDGTSIGSIEALGSAMDGLVVENGKIVQKAAESDNNISNKFYKKCDFPYFFIELQHLRYFINGFLFLLIHDFCVYLRGGDIRVPEQLANGIDVGIER